MKELLCIVEDDPTIRELVSEKLERNGYTVNSYDNAEELLSEKDGLKWDLYILPRSFRRVVLICPVQDKRIKE